MLAEADDVALLMANAEITAALAALEKQAPALQPQENAEVQFPAKLLQVIARTGDVHDHSEAELVLQEELEALKLQAVRDSQEAERGRLALVKAEMQLKQELEVTKKEVVRLQEAERQAEAERKRQAEAEHKRQAEAERQRRAEAESKRQAEAEAEHKRRAEAEAQAERMRAEQEAERVRQLEAERVRIGAVFEVRNAGYQACNGKYKINGTANGKPRYLKVDKYIEPFM